MRPLRVLAAAGSALVLLTSMGAWGVTRAEDSLNANIQTVDLNNLDPSPTPSGTGDISPTPSVSQTLGPVEAGKAFNVLLLGSDTRQGVGSGYGSASDISGARSDTAILLHISADRQWVSGISIPRDTVTTIPTHLKACGGQSSDKVGRYNEAFDRGGVACSVVTAEKLTGLPIQHVIAVNFKGFIDVIDNLGGLKVCLKAPINDPKSHLNLKGGTQTLDGTQALALARARKTLGDGSDISRTHRQQYIIHQLAAQVKASNLLTDPAKAYDVASALTKSLTTDTQLGTVQALASLGLELRDVQSSHIHLITLPWKPDPNNPNVTVVIDPKAAAGPLLAMSKDIEPQNAVTSSKVAGGGTLSTASPSPSSVVIPDAVAGSIFCPVSN